MAINKNNKNFQITLDPESGDLLKDLAERFNTSKSIIIRNALKVYAGKKSHVINLKFTLPEVKQTEQKPSSIKGKEPQTGTPLTEEESKDWDKQVKELEDSLPQKEDDPDKLPF